MSTKLPPVWTFRGDQPSALDMLEAIEEMQLGAPNVPPFAGSDVGDAESETTDVDISELEVLHEHPGEQHFTFFRADPFNAQRPRRLDMHVLSPPQLQQFVETSAHSGQIFATLIGRFFMSMNPLNRRP